MGMKNKGKARLFEIENSWTSAKFLLGKEAIPCRVEMKQNMKMQSLVSRYNARLVANGYVHNDGVEYDETFVPGVSFDLFLVTVGSFGSLGSHTHHSDSHTVFLKVDINVELFVKCYSACYSCVEVCMD